MSYSFKYESVISYDDIVNGKSKPDEKVSNKPVEASVVLPPGVFSQYPVLNLTTVFGGKKDLTSPEVTLALVSAGKVRPRPALVIPGTDKQAFNWTQTDLRHPPDRQMYASLMAAKLYEYVKPSYLLYRSNGTKTGLMNRMRDKLVAVSRPIDVKWFARVHTVVNQLLPLRKEVEWELHPSPKSPYMQKMATNASPGLPYMFDSKTGESPRLDGKTTWSVNMLAADAPKRGVEIPIVQHALVIASNLIISLGNAPTLADAKKAWEGLASQVPWLHTFILKRKDEKAERDDFLLKVRPYGVAPLIVKFMCQYAVLPLESRLVSFLDDPDSISAYKFSPYFGGATRLVQHFVSRLNSHKQVFISYGDDQLWAFKLADGRILVMGPDVSSMDMSTDRGTTMRIIQWFLALHPDMPRRNKNLFAIWAHLAFVHNLSIGASCVVEKWNSLISGIPGTTTINIFNSANIVALVKEHVKGGETEAQFYTNLSKALVSIAAKLNYQFKGLSSLVEVKSLSDVPHRIYANEAELIAQGITVPFLASVYVPAPDFATNGGYVAKPSDLFKLGSSLILPPRAPAKADINKLHCERLMGAYYSGGWMDPVFGEYLRNTFKVKRPTFSTALSDLGEVSTLGEDDLRWLFELTKEKALALPSFDQMVKFNTRPKEQCGDVSLSVDKLIGAASSIDVPPDPDWSDLERAEEVQQAEEEEAPSDDWTGAEAPAASSGVSQPPPPPPPTPAQPLSVSTGTNLFGAPKAKLVVQSSEKPPPIPPRPKVASLVPALAKLDPTASMAASVETHSMSAPPPAAEYGVKALGQAQALSIAEKEAKHKAWLEKLVKWKEAKAVRQAMKAELLTNRVFKKSHREQYLAAVDALGAVSSDDEDEDIIRTRRALAAVDDIREHGEDLRGLGDSRSWADMDEDDDDSYQWNRDSKSWMFIDPSEKNYG